MPEPDVTLAIRQFERMFKGLQFSNPYLPTYLGPKRTIPLGELITKEIYDNKTGEGKVYYIGELHQNLISVLKYRIKQLS